MKDSLIVLGIFVGRMPFRSFGVFPIRFEDR